MKKERDMVGKEDFEAGIYGETLSIIMRCLSEAHIKGYSQVQQETGLAGVVLDEGLKKLEELGFIHGERLQPEKVIGDHVFYQKLHKTETSECT